jgi:2-hydroxy-6-oxonona-2,4-dienedioate hydrolase
MTRTTSPYHRWHTVGGWKLFTQVFPAPAQRSAIPIVLVHGLGVSGRYMLPLAERLATSNSVFVPDLPGFGRSDKPPRALSVGALSDLLAGWLEEVGIEQASFLGNSMGCQVIVDLALRYSQHVHSAILVGPTIDRVGHTFARQMWRALWDLVGEPWSLWAILMVDYWATGTRRLIDTLHLALSDPVLEKFRHMNVPTLVVRGGRDPIAPQRWVEEVVDLLPQGRLAVIQSGTHATNYSAPDELAAVALTFMADIK